MEILGVALTGTAILSLSVLFLFMFAAIWYDHEAWAAKWIVAAILITYIPWLMGVDFTFAGLTAFVVSLAPILGYYLGIGAGYSIVEFVIGPFRMAKDVRNQWMKLMNCKFSNFEFPFLTWPTAVFKDTFPEKVEDLLSKDLMVAAQQADAYVAEIKLLVRELGGTNRVDRALVKGYTDDFSEEELVKLDRLKKILNDVFSDSNINVITTRGNDSFVNGIQGEIKKIIDSFINKVRHKCEYVNLKVDMTGSSPKLIPTINKIALAQCIVVWILFWPFYAVHTLIADLVNRIADVLASIFAKLGGRLVKAAFADILDTTK